MNADLRTLLDNDNSLAGDFIVINANDGRGGAAATQTIDVSVGVAEGTASINLINGDDIINNSYTYYPALGPYQVVGTPVVVPGGNVAIVNLSGDVTGFSSGDTFKVTVTDGYFAETYTATVGQSGTGWTATLPASDVGQLPNGPATLTANDDSGDLLATQDFEVEASAAPSNNGNLTISAGTTLEILGAYEGIATFASTTGGQLKLDASAQFTGKIAGFGGQDTLDLADIAFPNSTTLGFSENQAGTSGVLTLSGGGNTAQLALLVLYGGEALPPPAMVNGGTLITDPPLPPNQNLLESAQSAHSH